MKPYLAKFLFKSPPAGTGDIIFQALIKRGEANTGEFYYPKKDLRLEEMKRERHYCPEENPGRLTSGT